MGITKILDENNVEHIISPYINAPESVGDFTVRFFDFDGTILKETKCNYGESVTAPIVPTHEYLVFNSWNNDFDNIIKDIDIGAIYDTFEDKTYIYITLTPETGLSFPFSYRMSSAGNLYIDKGDGSDVIINTTTGTITTQLTYDNYGDYVITVWRDNISVFQLGSASTTEGMCFYSNEPSTLDIPRKIYISKYVTASSYMCYMYRNLEYCSLPNNHSTSLSSVFVYSGIRHLNIPKGVTNLGSTFLSTRRLETVTIPNSVAYTNLLTFQYATALKSVVFNAPFLTNVSSLLYNTSSIEKVDIPVGSTLVPGHFLRNSGVKEVNIPEGVNTLYSNAFNSCYRLSNIKLPSTLNTIETGMFGNCYSLESIKIPSGVEVIPDSCFASIINYLKCICLGNLQAINTKAFSNTFSSIRILILPNTSTPPSLASDTFNSLSPVSRIYVPDASVDAYKNATNWVTYASYIYPISDYKGEI